MKIMKTIPVAITEIVVCLLILKFWGICIATAYWYGIIFYYLQLPPRNNNKIKPI